MNLLLLHPEDRLENGDYGVAGRRARHIQRVLGLGPGEPLRAGLPDGPLGQARILEACGGQVRVAFTGDTRPPAPLPLRLILALPRPPMLHRALHDATTLGVKDIVVLDSQRVEKSFWQSRRLAEAALHETLLAGLEQAVDTMVPQVRLRRDFERFVGDELEAFRGDSRGILAHPGNHPSMPVDLTEPVTLAVGPEGGWIDTEIQALSQSGFHCHHFGSRIQRVETAVPALIGKLMRMR